MHAVIKSFRSAEMEAFGTVKRSRFQSFAAVAIRKLQMLDAATSLHDLSVVPGSRLELLKGNRKGQHSIRINDQWRLCFVWDHPNAFGVEITNHYG
jgi:proteic killer suppression protein